MSKSLHDLKDREVNGWDFGGEVQEWRDAEREECPLAFDCGSEWCCSILFSFGTLVMCKYVQPICNASAGASGECVFCISKMA